jgi:hypothetical protein
MNQLQAERSNTAGGLQLLLRPSCMLCLEAEFVLSQAGIAEFERIDIERVTEFELRYGERIPVLRRRDGVELDWPFDAATIRGFVDGDGQLAGSSRSGLAMAPSS